MAKNAATVVGRFAAIPEGDGGRDLIIQPVYITWTKKDGRLGLMRQWANVRIIDDKAFVIPRVDIELLRPIEWTMKEIDEIRDGQAVDEKKRKAKEKQPKVRPSSPKRSKEGEKENERRTSPRRSREASPSSVEGRLDREEVPKDPWPGTSRDVPLAKNPSTGTAQQRLFLVLKVVLHAVVVISEVLRLSTKSRCSRCYRAHL